MTKENKIRQRVSYKMFEKLSKIIDEDNKSRLDVIYGVLNGRGAFGSRTQAEYAKESLELFKKDILSKPCQCGSTEFLVKESSTHVGTLDGRTMHLSNEEPDGFGEITCEKCGMIYDEDVEIVY